MDFTTTLLFLQQGKNMNISYYEMLLAAIIYILYKYKDDIQTFLQTRLKKNNHVLTIEGLEMISGSVNSISYPDMMIAICVKLLNECNFKQFIYKDIANNKLDLRYWSTNVKNDECLFWIKDCENELIPKTNIYMSVSRENITLKESTTSTSKVKLTLTSSNEDVKQFANDALKQYYKNREDENKNKLYHFIFTGEDKDKKLTFSSTLLSEKSGDDKLTETFDHIFNEHTEGLKKDLKCLRNLEYYKKYGLKRKKGYLFYGNPGCGKTSTIMAMALYDNRHILEIPFSRIKTNAQFEELVNTTKINGITFRKDELLILFDEIDISNDAVETREKKDEPKKEDSKESPIDALIKADKTFFKREDALNLGILLSRLDGIGNYNGLVFVATTNYIDKLDPALYRDMRLSRVFFDYTRKEDFVKLFEKFYGKLSAKQIARLPTRENKITPSSVIALLERNLSLSVDSTIDKLLKMCKK